MALLSANRLGVFSALSDGPMTAEGVAETCGAHPRTTAMLLNACVAQGLLESHDGRYENTALAATFLVEGSPAFLGNALRYSEDLYPVWGNLSEAVRTNAPAMRSETILGDDPEKTRNFVYAMHDRASGIARSLTACLDLSGRTQLLDVGGGPGTYSMLLAEKTPGLQATVLDLPEVVAIAEEIIADFGFSERVTVAPGSYLDTDFAPGNDVVLMSGMLHRETPDTCRMLLSKAFDALVPGGLVVTADVFFDNETKDSPPFATLFALNMMLTSDHGSAHAVPEMSRWMAEAGFSQVDVKPLPPPMPHTILTAVKA